MRRLLEWWSDLTSVLTDPEVLTVLTIAGGLLAAAALALYSIWRWRVEKAFVEMEIRDVLARVDHYATVSAGPDPSAAAGRRQEYLHDVLERWMRLRYELWTDFQIYLAWRSSGSIEMETSRCAGQLAEGFRQMLAELWGSPDKPLAAAVVNNALATAFGMRPSAPQRPAFLEIATAPATAEGNGEGLLRLYDPYVMEEAVSAELQGRGASWLHRLLRTLEWQNAHGRLAGPSDGSHPMVLETVLWIVHEERIGPAPLSPEVLDIYEVSQQLLPHLPDFLRDSSIASVRRIGAKQLMVTFSNVILPSGTRFDGSIGLHVRLRADSKLWRSIRIELGVLDTTGALVFEKR